MTEDEARQLTDQLNAAFPREHIDAVAWASTLRYLDHAGVALVVADAIATQQQPRLADLGRLVAAKAATVPPEGRAAAARRAMGPQRGDREHWHGGPDPCPTCLPRAVETSLTRGTVSAHLADCGWTLDDCRAWRREHRVA